MLLNAPHIRSHGSDAMKLWKKAAKKAAATAAAKLEDEVLSDDPVSDASERKRLDEVIARAQASALPAGDVSRGGEEAGRAVRAAQSQADMAAFIAAHMVRAAAARFAARENHQNSATATLSRE